MADINEACKKLKSGDFIILQYDEGNSGESIEVIAEYSKCNYQGKNLSVRSVLIPSYTFRPDTKLHRSHLAEFDEIKGLVKLVPEKLF